MKLKKLIKDLSNLIVKGSREISITGISSHSKTVYPGNLFVAKRGMMYDGCKFIPEAISNGAVAILTDLYDPFLPHHVTQLIHHDLLSIEAELLNLYYHDPSSQLQLIGVTGTNGKTTTTYLIQYLLEGLGIKTGLSGTIESIAGEHRIPSNFATQDIATNYKLLHEMQLAGCKAAVLEASSHGLAQGRLSGLSFAVSVFTNITADHLDYHPTMQEYLAAKAKLFHVSKVAVVNADTDWVEGLLQGSSAKRITYGIECKADCQATGLSSAADGSFFVLHYKLESVPAFCPLIGKFNVYNYLAAAAVALSQGASLKEVVRILSHFKAVPGRLERIPNSLGCHIFVDYAHTGDGLENVLKALAPIKKGRLITLFGSGGDRDPNRRFQMGEVAERLSDVTILTTDNPRSEDPAKIIQDILSCFKNTPPVVEPDRRCAIAKALEMAAPGDIILIAGKGHETRQIFANQTLHFDDREVTRELLLQVNPGRTL